MGNLYAQLLKADPRRKSLTQQQFSWIKTRNIDCPTERRTKLPTYTCVSQRLVARIDYFEKRLQALGESDIEGPEEDDTGPGVVAKVPAQHPKSKPKSQVAQSPKPKEPIYFQAPLAPLPPIEFHFDPGPEPTAEIQPAPEPEPAVKVQLVPEPRPTGKSERGSETEPPVETRAPAAPQAPQVAESSTAPNAVVAPSAPPADDIDGAAMDAYRYYIMVRGCVKGGVMESADSVKPGLQKMDDALKRIGRNPEMLWKRAGEAKSEDGDFNTLLLVYSMMIPMYPVAQGKDKMDIENMCERITQLVDISSTLTSSKTDPSSVDSGPDISVKDF